MQIDTVKLLYANSYSKITQHTRVHTHTRVLLITARCDELYCRVYLPATDELCSTLRTNELLSAARSLEQIARHH